MTAPHPIKIVGLKEFSRNLRKMDSDLPKGLRLANNEAGQIVVEWAKSHIPKRSGKAAGSIKAKSTRTMARVTAYGSKVPYGPWLDFGGAVGRNNSVKRPFLKEGRYIYPGLTENYEEIHEVLVKALLEVARSAGVVVT